VGRDCRGGKVWTLDPSNPTSSRYGCGPGGGQGAATGSGRGQTVHYLRFQTGTDQGQGLPAAVCEVAPLGEGGVECWSPDDGYTLAMGGIRVRSQDALARQDRSRTRANYHRTLSGSDYLARGDIERYGSITCVSSTAGLTCHNKDGHGWLLPRYLGKPRIFWLVRGAHVRLNLACLRRPRRTAPSESCAPLEVLKRTVEHLCGRLLVRCLALNELI